MEGDFFSVGMVARPITSDSQQTRDRVCSPDYLHACMPVPTDRGVQYSY